MDAQERHQQQRDRTEPQCREKNGWELPYADLRCNEVQAPDEIDDDEKRQIPAGKREGLRAGRSRYGTLAQEADA